jgi:hypothetical protein
LVFFLYTIRYCRQEKITDGKTERDQLKGMCMKRLVLALLAVPCMASAGLVVVDAKPAKQAEQDQAATAATTKPVVAPGKELVAAPLEGVKATGDAAADKGAQKVTLQKEGDAKPPVKPALAPKPAWTLAAGHTVGKELQAWGEKAGWKVVWNMPKDWVVPSSTVFRGDFKAVASGVIKNLADNGAIIHAQFFDGNNTLVVSGPGVASQ